MRYLLMDEEEFWENPDALEKITFAGRVLRSGAQPQIDEADRPFTSRSSYFVLGDPNDESAPTGTVLRMPPAYSLPYHSHPTDIFMLVLRGALFVPGKRLGPGDGLVAKAHEMYGPEVAGPDGCTRVEFFASRRGATSVEFETPDGERRVWDYMTDGQSPWRTGMEKLPRLMAEMLRSVGEDRARLACDRSREIPRPVTDE